MSAQPVPLKIVGLIREIWQVSKSAIRRPEDIMHYDLFCHHRISSIGASAKSSARRMFFCSYGRSWLLSLPDDGGNGPYASSYVRDIYQRCRATQLSLRRSTIFIHAKLVGNVGHLYSNPLILFRPDLPLVEHLTVDFIYFFIKLVGPAGLEPATNPL